MTNWNGNPISYDLNGNMLSDGTNAFSWNARNQVATLNSVSLQYDGFGRRTKNFQNTSFLFDGANAVQELSGTTATANLISGGIDEIFARADATGSFTPLQDALGSTIALVDANGNLVTQYAYDPFGNTTVSGATNSNAFQYTGRENEGNGLYFYRARYYSPLLERFISEDPLRFKGSGPNVYTYGGDSPTNLIDPSGKSNSAVHYRETLEAARGEGMSLIEANELAVAVVAVDAPFIYPGTQGTDWQHTRMHAMAGRKANGKMQTCQQARQSAIDYLNQFTGINPSVSQMAQAIHAIQDSYSYSHGYQSWDGDLTMDHEKGDWPVSDEAVEATENFLNDVRKYGHAWGGANYLNWQGVCWSAGNGVP